MVFQALPADEQDVAAGALEAALQFVPEVAWHAGDDRRRFGKGGFEGALLARLHVEQGEFENHGCLVATQRWLG